MNKAELVEAVAEEVGVTRKVAGEIIEAAIATISATVARGERVALSGFGVFDRAERAARVGRNPSTGETVRIAPTQVPKFRPGTDFKDRVAGRSSSASANHSSARSTH